MAKKGFKAAIPETTMQEIIAYRDSDLRNEPAVTLQFTAHEIKEIPVELIQENPYQPRKTYSPESLEDLARSISAHGMLSPLVVRPNSDQTFTLIAGHRRWKACQTLGQKTCKGIERNATDQDLRLLALVENIFREDLHAVDKARAFRELNQCYSNQTKAAQAMGMKRTAFAQWLRVTDDISQETLDICGKIPNFTLNGLLRIAKLAPAKQSKEAKRLLTVASQPVNQAPQETTPVAKPQNKRKFEIRDETNRFSVFVDVHANTRKHILSREDIIKALRKALEELEQNEVSTH